MAKSTILELESDKILSTLDKLYHRIAERFPDSGLSKVCAEFRILAAEMERMAVFYAKPIWPVRITILICIIVALSLFIVAFGMAFRSFTSAENAMSISKPIVFFQTVESVINDIIFFSLAIYFLTSIETRIKRRKTLKALHQLRSLAHIIDMHQLTKDPVVITNLQATESSPQRTMTRFELVRYLDYCSEILSIISKIGALFSQNIADEIIHDQVNDLNNLTQSLSAKIWQKIMIMERE
jgi:hypothetical protein